MGRLSIMSYRPLPKGLIALEIGESVAYATKRNGAKSAKDEEKGLSVLLPLFFFFSSPLPLLSGFFWLICPLSPLGDGKSQGLLLLLLPPLPFLSPDGRKNGEREKERNTSRISPLDDDDDTVLDGR